MTVEAIKTAIEELPDQERRRLTAWLEELEERAWDQQMAADLGPGGRGGHLLEKIDRQIDLGNVSSLADGLRSRRKA